MPRWRPIALMTALVGFGAPHCSSDSAPDEPPGTFVEGAGAADGGWFHDRKLDYLRQTTREFHPDSSIHVLAPLARARLEPGYAAPGQVPATTWDVPIANMDALQDGRDFVALDYVYILLGFDAGTILAPELRAKVED